MAANINQQAWRAMRQTSDWINLIACQTRESRSFLLCRKIRILMALVSVSVVHVVFARRASTRRARNPRPRRESTGGGIKENSSVEGTRFGMEYPRPVVSLALARTRTRRRQYVPEDQHRIMAALQSHVLKSETSHPEPWLNYHRMDESALVQWIGPPSPLRDRPPARLHA